MRPLTVLALSIPCGWLVAAAIVLYLLPQLEDTTVGFDAPHLGVRLTLTK